MRRLVVFALALGALGALAPGAASAAASLRGPALWSPGGSAAGLGLPVHLHARYAHPVTRVSSSRAMAQAAAGTTVRMWRHTVTDGGLPYTYTMVGKNPFKTQTNPVGTTPVWLVPLALQFTSFAGETFDANAANPCDPGGKSDLTRVKTSPLFQTSTYDFGGTLIGAPVQYQDAFQLTEFWSKTKPGSANAGYADNLGSPHVVPVTVPVSGGDVVAGTCGDIGLMDYSTWDSYLQTQLFPELYANVPGLGPNSLVIFLLHNTVLYNGSLSNCCILGYHSAFTNASNALQTYASVEYDTDRSFSGVEDIAALSHEVGEWMNDPLGNNPTPSWGNIGQVSGCQNNLEVGDPLSGTTMRVFMNGITYHPQELAYVSWFYHQSPSMGINGWYSDNDSLETSAAPC